MMLPLRLPATALALSCAMLPHVQAQAAPKPDAHQRQESPDAAALAAQRLRDSVGLATFTAHDFRPGTVKHMVMFRLRPTATDAERKAVVQDFLDLARLSRRPDGSPVVQSIETGVQDSGEGVDGGLQLGFLVTFASQGDRNFYVGRPIVTDPKFFDPAHEHYKQKIAPLLTQAMVFDFPVTATAPQPPATGQLHP